MVPLVNGEQDRSAATLLPLITKFILPGTIFNSGRWQANTKSSDEGYSHYVINHSEVFVDPHNPIIHYTNERL